MKKTRNFAFVCMSCVFFLLTAFLGCSGSGASDGGNGGGNNSNEGGSGSWSEGISLNQWNAKEILGEDYLNQETVEIPESVTTIECGTFGDIGEIKTLIIPCTVTTIEPEAFHFNSLNNPEQMRWFDSIYYKGTIEQWCEIEFSGTDFFYGHPMQATRHFYIDDEEVKRLAINDDGEEDIATFVIPGSVKVIKDFAFCQHGYAAFEFGNVVIEEGVRSIGKGAFSEAWLNSIVIPGSVESIGDYAFARSRLSEIKIGNGVKSIGESAFSSCSLCCDIGAYGNGWTLTIPGSVKSIGGAAFDSTNLTKVVIEEGVESIGDWAFCGSALNDIVIPSSVVSIGDRAFYRCFTFLDFDGNVRLDMNGQLRDRYEVVIPEGVKSIGDNAFDDCKCLTQITLPSSLETIGEGAFKDCNYLEKVLPEDWKNDFFSDGASLTEEALISRLKQGNLVKNKNLN